MWWIIGGIVAIGLLAIIITLVVIVIGFDGDSPGKETEDTSAPRSRPKTVTIKPYWLGEIFTRKPIQIPASVDVTQFFEQNPLPPLFDDPGYASLYCSDKDRGFHWVAVFISHPDENIVLDAFRYWEKNWNKYTESEVKMNYRTVMFICAATKLLSNNLQVVKAAAEFIWRGYSENNFGKLFRVPLTDLGKKQGYMAAKRLVELCPEDKKEEALFIFEKLCREYFGRSML